MMFGKETQEKARCMRSNGVCRWSKISSRSSLVSGDTTVILHGCSRVSGSRKEYIGILH